MTSVEYGRHVRRVLDWDEVEVELDSPTPRVPVDLSHGSVFIVDEDEGVEVPPASLLSSVARLFGRR